MDASSRMGSGHVMRCLALADALAERGAAVTFVSARLLPGMAERIQQAGHAVVEVRSSGTEPAQTADWDGRAAPPEAQVVDGGEVKEVFAGRRFSWAVVDHYLLGAPWEEAIRPLAAQVMSIDDLANRPHACDLLLDQTAGRSAADYRPLVPADCSLLMGAAFALLRPGFAKARPASLLRRRQAAAAKRILVFLGGTDIGGVTGTVAAALCERLPDSQIDVVIGGAAESRPLLERLAREQTRIRLHIDTPEMPALMVGADLAIGAAGSASWERCCLGVPTVMLVMAENQRLVADNLGAIGAAVAAASPMEAVDLAARLAGDVHALQSMVAAAAGVTDGGGTELVADALTGPSLNVPGPAPLAIRRATAEDSESIWLWRNDPVTRSTAKTTEPVPWEQHARWYAACLESADRLLFVGEVRGERVGMTRFDRQEDGSYLVSINVAPRWRGRKIGSELLGKACEALLAETGSASVVAEIHDGNTASQRIFARCGFRRAGSSADGWGRYVRTIGTV